MKKAKLISLIALSPIGVVTPIVVTSCSSSTSSLTSVKYGSSYTIKSNDRSAAKTNAENHLNMCDEQNTYTLSNFTVKYGTHLTPTDFYWELMYAMANSGSDFSLSNWTVNASNQTTFTSSIGNATTQKAQYVNNNGKVGFKFTTSTGDKTYNSHRFELITITG